MDIAQEILDGFAHSRKAERVFADMLAGSIKPYRAYSEIYKGYDGRDPYVVDWLQVFTPIEYGAWCSIREYGLPFYPQYPVHGVILDFADPKKKIALECDGKEWHDAVKDQQRDAMLAEHGWRVYRVTGSECNSSRSDLGELKEKLRDEDITQQEFETKLLDWLNNTSDGVVAAIAALHYGYRSIDAWDASQALKGHCNA